MDTGFRHTLAMPIGLADSAIVIVCFVVYGGGRGSLVGEGGADGSVDGANAPGRC